MDHDSHSLDGVDAERSRMNAFSFGKPVSPSGVNPPARHSRSHSRNSSVSVPLSLSTSVSTSSMNDLPPQSPARDSISGSKRNSHHRRRSSVSTRRESADLMGISLPSIPISSSEDNINLGDKDSIRRRALWALEGKDAGGNFSVEIPELDAPEVPKRNFEFPTKPSFPPGMGGGFNGGLSNLMGSKRDSVRCMASSPSSEMLGTLIEEEEEEEEDVKDVTTSPAKEVTVPVKLPSSVPFRPRPASLNLRPLALALNASAGIQDVPTPTTTPNSRPGLKSLTLTSSPSSTLGGGVVTNKRQSLIMSSSPSYPPVSSRPSLNLMTEHNPTTSSPGRRSSISYVTNSDGQTVSVYGLPTPEMTPTSSTLDRRRSTSVSSSGSMDLSQLNMQRGRPLSMSEQHFLFQAHETLVQRITDLERALAQSSRSRPVSCASDVSWAPSEPSDEMLQLIADLKAERDELKKDVDGWRTRVANLQHQIDVHAKRLEVERRDAWVARQRVSLFEVEKAALERSLADRTAQASDALARLGTVTASLQTSQGQVQILQAEVQRLSGADDECARLRAELLQERKKRAELERDLDQAGLLDTPRPFNSATNGIPVSRTMAHAKRGLGFRSIDSESSCTDVDSLDDDHQHPLKAVQEVDEDDDATTSGDEDDELARYEDEEEDDEYAFPTSTSYESVMEYSRSTTPRLSTDSADSAPSLCTSRSPSVSPTPLPSPAEPTHPQDHSRHKSLSNTWTFPSGPASVPTVPRPGDEIDRFFGCLEDVDNSPPLDSKLHSIESNKNIFAQALAEHDDDFPPFLLPADVGDVVLSPELESPMRSLDVVLEEDEDEEEATLEQGGSNVDDEFVGEVDEGGIKFVFNPPPSYVFDDEVNTSSSDVSLTASDVSTATSSASEPADEPSSFFDFVEKHEEDSGFTLPKLKAQRRIPSPSAIPRLRSPSPSMLPRSVSSPVATKVVAPVPRRAAPSPTAFSTPPPKRSVTAPTFIPQPRGSPSTPSKTASMIPKLQRASTSPKPSAIPVRTSPVPTGLASRSPSVTPRPPGMNTANGSPPSQESSPSPPVTCSPSLMSPSLASRFSFQALTNFIPVPSILWSPRLSDTGSECNSPVTSSLIDHTRTSSAFVNPAAMPTPGTPKERAYVPKEKQLEKLRLRMEEERKRSATVTGLGLHDKRTQAGLLDI